MSTQSKKEILFSQWTRQMLYKYFGIRKKNQCQHLEEWLKANDELSDFEKQFLQFFGYRARKAIYDWKEADLRDNFIAPIVSLADFHSEELVFTSFSEASLQAEYKNITLKGNVEWMTAMGINQPNTPFFFIHEYKSEEPRGNIDGRGQLLAMMLAAQVLNEHPSSKFKPFPGIKIDKKMPMYGSYVIGINWYFMVLKGHEFCMSKAFDITDEEELFKVFQMLKAQKRMIVERIKAAQKGVVFD